MHLLPQSLSKMFQMRIFVCSLTLISSIKTQVVSFSSKNKITDFLKQLKWMSKYIVLLKNSNMPNVYFFCSNIFKILIPNIFLSAFIFDFLSYGFFFFFCLSVFSRAELRHMEVPRLGVRTELWLPAYTTATATRDLSRVCDLHHSSRQCWIL